MRNELTPEQDMIVRQFYTLVVGDRSLSAWQTFSAKTAVRMCMSLLGYVIYQGKFLHAEDLPKGVEYGKEAEVTCRWADDTRAVEAALHINRPVEADNRSESESSEVGESILS